MSENQNTPDAVKGDHRSLCEMWFEVKLGLFFPVLVRSEMMLTFLQQAR
jgi:hypothetical protein